jgi:hypothetical protein
MDLSGTEAGLAGMAITCACIEQGAEQEARVLDKESLALLTAEQLAEMRRSIEHEQFVRTLLAMHKDKPREYGPPLSEKVIRAMADANFGQHVAHLRWSADGCWLFLVHGMTVGVETDGYIHS